jgi:hypothetical protein
MSWCKRVAELTFKDLRDGAELDRAMLCVILVFVVILDDELGCLPTLVVMTPARLVVIAP